MTSDALPAGAPTPTDETLSADIREQWARVLELLGSHPDRSEILATLHVLRLRERQRGGLRSRQTRDEDGQRDTDALCWCGHAESAHIKPSLGALLGGVWGCLMCRERRGLEHMYSPDTSVAPSTPQNEGSSQ